MSAQATIYGLDPRGNPRVHGRTVKQVLAEAARYVRHHKEAGPLELWVFAEPMETESSQ